MGITRYGVLKGHVDGFRRENDDSTPHFQLFLEATGRRFRVPVNVRSQLSPSELVYRVVDDFRHPMTEMLGDLPPGYTRLRESERRGLDYIRSHPFDLERVIALPHNLPGQDNDLQDVLTSHAEMACNAGTRATVYAFGEPFPDVGVEGMHDVHMNQGNHPRFQTDDGVFRDGGLIFHFPDRDRFVAIFLAFQSQALHTDDITGHAIPGSPTFEDIIHGNDRSTRDGHIRIVAALINPEGHEHQVNHTGRREALTLLNTTAHSINLDDWALVDKSGNHHVLDGPLGPGDTRKVEFDGSDVRLSNSGGMITLLDSTGLKVDGISYAREQGKAGVTVPLQTQ